MGECDLCGEPSIVTLALLRVAWETRSVQVQACQPCGARAWRTVTGEAPLIGSDPAMPMLPWGAPSRSVLRVVVVAS